jgi:flagellar basal-body rod modification protein FlgD
MQVYNNSPISGNVVSKDAGKSALGKDSFLKILTAQLQNQDPMNPSDNTEYVAQMAQFTALEQMQNLNAAMGELLVSQKFQEGSAMIGKLATISLGSDNYISGEVSSAKLGYGSITIVVDGKEYSIDDVIELKDKGSETVDV